MEEEVKRLRAAANGPTSQADTDKGGEKGDDVEKLRCEIQALKSIDGADELRNRKEEELRKLQAERQAARPIHQQLRDVEAKLERKSNALSKKKLEVTEAQQALDKATQDVLSLETEIAALKADKGRLGAAGAAAEAPGNQQRAETLLQEIAGGKRGDEGYDVKVQELSNLVKAVVPSQPPPPQQEVPMEFDDEEEKALDALLDEAIQTHEASKDDDRQPSANSQGSGGTAWSLVERRRKLKDKIQQQASGMVRKRLKR